MIITKHLHLLDVRLRSRGLVLYSGKYSYIIFCWKDYQMMWHQVSSVHMSRLRMTIMLLFHVLNFLFCERRLERVLEENVVIFAAIQFFFFIPMSSIIIWDLTFSCKVWFLLTHLCSNQVIMRKTIINIFPNQQDNSQ